MKILYLTLKKQQFEVTLSGEKMIEYRRNCEWILSRLINKNYDAIKFVNGYGKTKPFFMRKFKGWGYTKKAIYKYSNGLEVNVEDNDIAINLGKIIK